MIVVAHLFGGRFDLAPVTDLARTHDLLLVEDCAQSIQGPDDDGDPRADVSLFSFGFIKTATAFGGALARVRDDDLAHRMEVIHRRWPIQSAQGYFARAARSVAMLPLRHPGVYGTVTRPDPDILVTRLTRTIAARSDAAFLTWLRRRPCRALADTLERRLAVFPTHRLEMRGEAGDKLASELPVPLVHLGTDTPSTHWLFPVLAPHPPALIAGLRASGFDATRGASQIGLVPTPADRPKTSPGCARRLIAGTVFLPAYPELPASERRRLVEELETASAKPAGRQPARDPRPGP